MQLREKIVGNPKNFDFRHRLLNLISFIGSILVFFLSVASHWLVKFELTLALYVTLVLTGLGYLVSRFFNNPKFAYGIFYFLTFFGIISNYIYGSGFNGTALYWLFTGAVLLSLGSPKHYIKYIISGILVVFICLFYIQLQLPEIIISSYETQNQFHADLLVSIVLGVIFIGLGIFLFANQYDIESLNAEKNAEELIKQRNKFERLNQEKLELLSIISHDFKAPLDLIDSTLTHLDKDEMDEVDLKKQLLVQTRNTSQLLSNLLIWSKNQIQNSTPDISPIDIGPILENCFFTYVPIADQKDILLQIKNVNNIKINADKQLIGIVVRNLLNNAIKFTEAGKEVKLIAKVKSNQLRVEVIDAGIGINIIKQHDILDQKIASTYGTQNEKGIGLGLQIIKNSLDKMNSKLQLNSEEGKGSRFFFDLPLA